MDKETKDSMIALCDEQNKTLCTLKNRFEFMKDQTEEVINRLEASLLSLDDVVVAIQAIKIQSCDK